MTDYIPTTEEVANTYAATVYHENSFGTTRPHQDFYRWLEQLKQEVRQDEREKVAQEIEVKFQTMVTKSILSRGEIRSDVANGWRTCLAIARGDSE